MPFLALFGYIYVYIRAVYLNIKTAVNACFGIRTIEKQRSVGTSKQHNNQLQQVYYRQVDIEMRQFFIGALKTYWIRIFKLFLETLLPGLCG